MNSGPRQARWVYLLILAFALIEPATHLWLKYGLSGDVAHSGLHIGDTPFYLTDMRIFGNGFHSPYVLCSSVEGPENPWLFALPHHWLYGGLGWLSAALHLDDFLVLGFANGLCGAFYLWMALRFFRYVMPDKANLAFLFLCLGGGLGGLVWLATLPLGLHAQPNFELWFHRFARYELIEGPFLSPALILPRLYYTLPLGIGFAALMAFIDSVSREHSMPSLKAIVLQLLCTYLNARVGMLFWGVAVCFMIGQPVLRTSQRWRYSFYYLLPTAVAAMLVSIPFGLNSHGAANVAELLRRSAWIGSLATATFWAWPVLALVLWRHVGQLGWFGRLLAGWCIGYGAAFFMLYLGHQAWYGNWLGGGDTAAAIALSDWALLGLLPGSFAVFRRGHVDPEAESETWISLWFLGLACVSIAAVGQGWFMRAMPERGLVLLGPPLALLLAEGVTRLRDRFPRVAFVYAGVILTSGLASLAVGALCFQGPLGHTPGKSAFGQVHSEVILASDKAVLDLLERGRVLAPASLPPLMGDVAVARYPEITTVFGQPTLEFGDTDMLGTAQEVQRFFSPDATELFRIVLVEDWCVDFVFCPATRPVDPAVLEELKATSWLERVGEKDGSVLFRVLIRVGGPYA